MSKSVPRSAGSVGRPAGVEAATGRRRPRRSSCRGLPVRVTLISRPETPAPRQVERGDRPDVRPGVLREDRAQRGRRCRSPSSRSRTARPCRRTSRPGRGRSTPAGTRPRPRRSSRSSRRRRSRCSRSSRRRPSGTGRSPTGVPLRRTVPAVAADRGVRGGRLGPPAAIDLRAGVVVDVERAGRRVDPVEGVRAGRDRLRLQRLDRPARRHLGRHDAAQVVVDRRRG